MKKIRVLHTIRQGSIGGGETYLFNLAVNLDPQKFESVVLSFTDGEMVTALRAKGITAHVINTTLPFSFHLYPAVKKIIKDEKIDLVHMHGTRAASNTLIPAKLAGVPAIYTVHGWSFHTGSNPLKTKLRKIAEKYLSSMTNLTICGSMADKNDGEALGGKAKFELIHNSIDSTKFTPGLTASGFRRANGYSDSDFIVASVARMTFQKNPETFIKAAAIVKETFPEVKFVAVGDGELKETCIKLAAESGLSDTLRFLPFSTNVYEVLEGIDVFVLPSLWEVIPLALLEAMSMQKFCIATNIPGTTEALEHNKNGLLFSPGNADELAAAVKKLYTEKDSLLHLKTNARQTVQEKFDLKKLVENNEITYSRVIKNFHEKK